MLCFYVKYRVLRFFSYLCTQNIIVMVDKRTLEFILTDQQEEMEGRAEEALCQRREESLIDIKSMVVAGTGTWV